MNNNIDPNQFLLYSPVAHTPKTEKIKATLPEEQGLNPKTMNENLQAMKAFYDAGGEFSSLQSGEKTTQKAGESLSGGMSSSLQEEKKSAEDKKDVNFTGFGGMMGIFMPQNMPQKTPEEKNKDIMQQLKNNEKAWGNYQKISVKEKEKFVNLAEKLYSPFIGGMGGMGGMAGVGPGNITGGTNPALIQLLEQGKLQDKDSQGKTLLDNLTCLEKQKFPDAIDGKFMIGDVLNKTTNPDFMKMSFHSPQITDLEWDNAKNNPSEYTRIIAGLTDEKGEVKLRNGERLTRNKELLDKAQTGPIGKIMSASQIYQGSVKDYMESSNLSPEKKKENIMKQIGENEKAKKAFEEMSREEQKDFLDVAGKNYLKGIEIMDAKIPEGISQGLINYLNIEDRQKLSALQGILQVEDYGKEYIQGQVKDLTLLPETTLKKLKEGGLKNVHVADRNVPELDSNQVLKGKHPRGWTESSTWDEVQGAYNPVSKSACSGKESSGSASVILHEMGHAIGDLVKADGYRLDDHPQLIEAHKRLYDKLPPYLQQEGPGGRAGRQEFLAESVAVLLKKGEKEAEKLYDPDYVKFLKTKVLA